MDSPYAYGWDSLQASPVQSPLVYKANPLRVIVLRAEHALPMID